MRSLRVYQNADKFGGDRNRLYVSGHSSGGHLTGCVVTTDWEKDFGLPKDVLKGGMLASGMYDLEPVRLLEAVEIRQLHRRDRAGTGAIRHLDRLNCPVVVAYGTQETPEFQRQSRDFAAALKAAGKPHKFLVGEGYNHFEIQETLASPYGLLGRAVLELMKLV